jgi:hypothetical protein
LSIVATCTFYIFVTLISVVFVGQVFSK